MRIVLLIFTVASFMTGCQYSPYADRYTFVEPSEEDVVGIYEFDFQTVDYSVDKQKIKESRPIIIINSDKTYRIERLPYFKLGIKFDKQISISGTWKIEELNIVEFGNGSIKWHWGLILESAPDELKYAGLLGTEKPNGMIFKFGDPDQGDVMILNKK